MLENYYDLARADQFQQLFGHLKIGANPTPKRNQYFMMKWDFSMVKVQGDLKAIETALHEHLNDCISGVATKYCTWLPLTVSLNPHNALSSFYSLLTVVQQTPHQLYLLIDEYDNFANEVLMSQGFQGQQSYSDLVSGEGLLKTVFKAVKAASADDVVWIKFLLQACRQ